MKPHFKIWIVFGDVKFGAGRAQLLELVDRLGSLKQAVDRVGMSYRHGWGYFRELERESGVKLLEPRSGEGPRAGMRLTAEGRRFLMRYRRFQRLLDTAVQRHFGRVFGSEGGNAPLPTLRGPLARSAASPQDRLRRRSRR